MSAPLLFETQPLVMDIKNKELKEKLSACSNIDEFNIEVLDKDDYRKNVLISFANPVNIRGIEIELKNMLGIVELPKKNSAEQIIFPPSTPAVHQY